MISTKQVLLSLVGATLLAGLVWTAQQRGAWVERVRDLNAQVDSTKAVLALHAADSLRWQATLSALRVHALQLAQDSQRFQAQLVHARRGRVEAELALTTLRGAVVEADLAQPVRDLLAGERRSTEAAQGEATACQALLDVAQEQRSTCEAEKATLQQEIVSLEGIRARLSSERDSALALLRPPSVFSPTLAVTAGPACVATLSGPVSCGLGVQVSILQLRIPLFGRR
jgi:hypothetical protein